MTVGSQRSQASWRSVEAGLLSAIESIYDAAAVPERWAYALDRIRTLVHARAAVLLYGESAGEARVLAALGIAGPGLARLVPVLRDRAETVPLDRLTLVRLDAASGDAQAVIGVPLRDGAALAVLCLVAQVGGGLAPSHGETLRELLPHLQRALLVHHRVERAERRATVSGEAFDRMTIGAVLVDAHGRPLFANRAARRIVARCDGLEIGVCGLQTTSPEGTLVLQRTIADVIRGDGGRESAGLRLARGPSIPPYEVIVLPLGRRQAEKGPREPAAVVFVSERGFPAAARGGLLRDLYGLTAAEIRLALLLVAGRTLAEAAESLEISRNTAHTHLASVFRKTDCSGQPDLVRVLLGGVVAVRPPGESSDSYPAVPGETQ